MKIEEMSALLFCYLYTVIYFSIFLCFLCKRIWKISHSLLRIRPVFFNLELIVRNN